MISLKALVRCLPMVTKKKRWWVGASRVWLDSTTTAGFSWSDGSEWDLFDSALATQIGERTGSKCFLYNDLYPSKYIQTQYTDELDFELWTAASEIADYLMPAVYLLPSSYTENGDCDATNFYAWEVAAEEPEAALDTCTRCSDAVGLEQEEDSERVGYFGIYGAMSCAQLEEGNADNFCGRVNDQANDIGYFDDSLEEGKYYVGEVFRQFCPYKCKKGASVETPTCQALDFIMEFSVPGQEEILTCSMVAEDLDLCENDAIWWTCPQTCYTSTDTDTDTDNDTDTDMDIEECVDKDKKEFDIDVDGEGNVKTKNCEWLESKKKKKKKQYCKQKVQINGNNKKLHTICKNTCGLVGKGECGWLKDGQ